MLPVMSLNGFEMLVKMIPRVYRTYHIQGFSYDYFTTVFPVGIKVMDGHLMNIYYFL
ncbi:MAG: hypothetical protein WCP87_03985 [Atribacterota bacterium]